MTSPSSQEPSSPTRTQKHRGALLVHPNPKRDLAKCTSRHPKWAVDPLTKRLMEFPVTIKAPCEHVVDKSTFVAWINQGNTVCPVCYTPMTQVSAIPNKSLATRIQALTCPENSNKNLPEEELEDPVTTNEELNSSLNFDGIFDSEPTLKPIQNHDDPIMTRLSQSEDLTSAAARYCVAGKSARTDPKRLAPTVEEEEEKECTTTGTTKTTAAPTTNNYNSPPTTPIMARPKPKVTSPVGLFQKLCNSNSPSGGGGRGRVVKTCDMHVNNKRRGGGSPLKQRIKPPPIDLTNGNSPPNSPPNAGTNKPGIYETLKRNLTGEHHPHHHKIPVLKKTVG